LVVEQVRLGIRRYQFLSFFDPTRHAVLQKLHKSDSVVALAEEEVETVAELLDLDGRGLRVLF